VNIEPANIYESDVIDLKPANSIYISKKVKRDLYETFWFYVKLFQLQQTAIQLQIQVQSSNVVKIIGQEKHFYFKY
jgi:hypothetical protein